MTVGGPAEIAKISAAEDGVDTDVVLGHPTAVRNVIALVLGLALLILASGLSLFVGSGDISAQQVIAALTGDGQSTTDLLVRDFRLPRLILAILVGLALALSGVVMQALTRNPLADPGLLGVNAGSFFFIVVGSAFFGITGIGGQVVSGIVGAGVAAFVVYVLGTTGPGAGTPAKLVLSGVAIAAVLSGVSQAIALSHPTTFDKLRFWAAGSLQGRSWESVSAVWVLVLLTAVGVALLSMSLNTLSMGDDLATALGANVVRIRVIGFVLITLLCGAATAVAGPITFVGLMIPFVVKFIVGVDHRWVIAFSALAGPLLLVCSDMVARVIIDAELPVGIVTAFVGAPVLIFLVRRTKMTAL